MKRFRDCYNQNPPEPIIEWSDIPPSESEIFEQMIEEHLYEENYEKSSQFIDIEELRIAELIKNGKSDQTIQGKLSRHIVS